VQHSLDRLIERDLVEFEPPNRYRVTDVFLGAWVARLTNSSA
jgi:hypothetical protein